MNNATNAFFKALLQSFNIIAALRPEVKPSMLMPTYAFNIKMGLYIM